jgi:hypothetical protein
MQLMPGDEVCVLRICADCRIASLNVFGNPRHSACLILRYVFQLRHDVRVGKPTMLHRTNMTETNVFTTVHAHTL